MSDVIPIGTKVNSVKTSPQFDTYSKVVVKISNSEAYEAGNDTGRTLEVSNPWGTQEIADHILARLQGRTPGATRAFRYTPYDADGAVLDPAAEMGDYINAADVFGGIFTRKRTFGRLMKANVSSPADEEIDHEYQFESPQRREYTRMFGEVKASIMMQAGEIEAKVSKKSPTGQTSFSWSLTDSAHIWRNNGNEVMRVDGSGLTVKGNGSEVMRVDERGLTVKGSGEFSGKITASSGEIGGFTISASAIYNGINSFTSSASSGVYIGTNGLRLGNSFRVGTDGVVKARNIELTGDIAFKNNDGTTVGTLSTSAVFSGAGGGVRFNQATTSGSSYTPPFFKCGSFYMSNRFTWGRYDIQIGDLKYEFNGQERTAKVLFARA